MKNRIVLKLILLLAASLFLTAGTAFASTLETHSGFPYTVELNMEAYDKLCYAGHVTGGGIFYNDGSMILPSASFQIVERYAGEQETFSNLAAEVDLIYENSDSTGCIREVIKKYDYGNVKSGKEYPLLSEASMKNLKQRRKLYSSEVMSMKLVLTYQGDGGTQKKQTFLLYLAKDDEYNDKKDAVSLLPEE